LDQQADEFDLFAEDWFASESQPVNDPLKEVGSLPTLFKTDFDYLSNGIQRIEDTTFLKVYHFVKTYT